MKIRRSRQWAQCGFVEINGILTTGIDRTILDLAAVVSPTKLNHAVDAVIRQKLTTWPDLYHVLVIHSRRGRNGCGPLRKILDARFGDTAIPDSRWNRNVGSLLFDAGLPEPEYEYEITGSGGEFVARVDLAYPNDRVAIELDSVRWHLNHASFRDDPRRKNKLMLEGWTVLTFTWSDYVDTPNDLVRTVRIARSSKPEAA